MMVLGNLVLRRLNCHNTHLGFPTSTCIYGYLVEYWSSMGFMCQSEFSAATIVGSYIKVGASDVSALFPEPFDTSRYYFQSSVAC